MKIGFQIRSISFGGGERVQQMLIHEFAKLGHEIVLFTWGNVELINYNFPHDVVILKRKRNKFSQFIYELYQIPRELISRKLDCIIVFGLEESFILSSFFTKTSSIVSLRVDPRFKKSQIFLKQRCLISFSLSRGVVFQTEKVQKYFSRKIQSKSVVITNPIIDDHLLTPRIIRKHKIVSVGRLSLEKNFSMLIKAFANICHEDYTLHIYGEGELQIELENLILKTGMKDKIILEGYVDRVVDKISDAEIYVLCSDFEGIPNSLIEGMAMGLACISTNFPSGAAADLINNYENGILIQVGDQKQLENSIKLLIKDKEFCIKLMNNATRVREVLKKEIIIDKWINYIISILN
ncbi:MAG: glycosyltransferase [Bacteroidales bacterium]|nr:glycosyltransferase [Bacteroidales bacterium]